MKNKKFNRRLLVAILESLVGVLNAYLAYAHYINNNSLLLTILYAISTVLWGTMGVCHIYAIKKGF